MKQQPMHLHPMTGGIALDTKRGTQLESRAKTLATPPKLLFPLNNGYNQYSSLVSNGQTVSQGQPIARTSHQQQLHTGLSGTVQIAQNHIIIHTYPEQHHEFNHHETESATATIGTYSNETQAKPVETIHSKNDLQQQLSNMGVLGLGGAMFPTSRKLHQQHIHTLLINGVECEPMLTADACLMTHLPHKIISGIQFLIRILDIPRALFAIEEDKPLAIQNIRKALSIASILEHRVQLHTIKARYPAGGSRQLYEQVFGRRLKSTEHSSDKGVLSLNVHTIVAIADAIIGRPLTHRIVTIAGDQTPIPQNLWLPIGTPLSWIQQQLTLACQNTTEVRFGGPLMGRIITNPEEPIGAGTSAIIFQKIVKVNERPCIQCGDCNMVCPEALQPQALIQFIHAKRISPNNPSADQNLSEHQLNACIACGACDLVCPSEIPLTTAFTAEQKVQQAQQQSVASAQRAKANYDARQLRLTKPLRANPPLVVQPHGIGSKKNNSGVRKARDPSIRLKTQLAKSQRLYREASAALAQAKKKQLDEQTLAQYQERVDQMQAKAQAAQAALKQALPNKTDS